MIPEGRKPLSGTVKFIPGYDVINFPAVTRVEVIDDNGRSYSEWDVHSVKASVQDDGKTLKIFLKKNKE
jgi:hypothetical protein